MATKKTTTKKAPKATTPKAKAPKGKAAKTKAMKVEVPQPEAKKARAKKAKTTPEKADKKFSQFQAAIKVLAEAKGPMNCVAMVAPDDRMLDRVRQYLTRCRRLEPSLIEPLVQSGK